MMVTRYLTVPVITISMTHTGWDLPCDNMPVMNGHVTLLVFCFSKEWTIVLISLNHIIGGASMMARDGKSLSQHSTEDTFISLECDSQWCLCIPEPCADIRLIAVSCLLLCVRIVDVESYFCTWAL